ncbi:MAG: EAL domain-containing protein [Polaromonas sp.]|nr:EAL domain-containing protein [Polaromonas sp.]
MLHDFTGEDAAAPPATQPSGGSLLDMAERTAHIGSWSMDLPGHRVMHSDEFAAILGVPRGGALLLDAMTNRFTPDWRQRLRTLLHRCSQDGTPFDAEMQIASSAKAAQTTQWVRAVGEAVRNDQGRIVRLQGALQDISAQKQAQRETLRLAMRLTTTLASITEAFFTLDRQCCFTYLNQESERLLQRSTGDLLGLPIWQEFAGGVGDRLKQQLEKSLASHRRVEFEDFYPPLDKWLEVRAYPFAEGLAVYFRDVSERRKSQEQLMLLQTSISRLNDIVLIAEALPAGESAPRIVFVNDAFEQHTGYLPAEVMGKTPRMMLGPEPQLRELRRMSEALQKDGQVRSELRIFRKDGSWFWVELEIVLVLAPAGQLTHWVAVGRNITQRKAAEDEIHHLAFYDPLTNLPNRQLLMDRLQRALTQSARTRHQGALMFIDVDNFKALNDTLGHHKGDQLLQKVATRLLDCVRKTDTVARLGGDEFVIMLEDLGDEPDAAAARARVVAEKVLDQLRTPFDLDGHQHHASASMGVTAFSGLQGSVNELLKQADLAMYQAKTLGRNNVCFFDPALQAAASAKAALISDLRIGLQAQQFLLYYQPQVDRHGGITGVEALLRWQHPRQGLVAPADFIPAAEDTGLILPLGQWALESACAQLAAWAGRPETAGLSVAVNVSVRQFRHPDFVDMVMATIARTGIAPHRLKLELTESLLADRMEITIAKMGSLKALGVTLAIDDFGMGYSSLSVLKRLPLDQLKIDRTFVADLLTDPNDAAISRAIITLAQSLGLGVVAEGVETQAQRDFLIRQGCEHFQGYLFSEPLPIAQLEAYLRVQPTCPASSPSSAP